MSGIKRWRGVNTSGASSNVTETAQDHPKAVIEGDRDTDPGVLQNNTQVTLYSSEQRNRKLKLKQKRTNVPVNIYMYKMFM